MIRLSLCFRIRWKKQDLTQRHGVVGARGSPQKAHRRDRRQKAHDHEFSNLYCIKKEEKAA